LIKKIQKPENNRMKRRRKLRKMKRLELRRKVIIMKDKCLDLVIY
jgi:hypothetical protein